jgi:hypothetical protein
VADLEDVPPSGVPAPAPDEDDDFGFPEVLGAEEDATGLPEAVEEQDGERDEPEWFVPPLRSEPAEEQERRPEPPETA